MAKAFSYLRFSTPEQRRGDSFRRQSAAAVKWATAHRHELDDSVKYHDPGRSAFRGRHARVGKLGEFMAALQAGVIQPGCFLLVEDLDRLSRGSPREATRILQNIIEAGASIVDLGDNGHVYDEASLDDYDVWARMLGRFSLAHRESKKKSERIKEVWAEKREQAKTRPMTSIGPPWLVLKGKTWRVLEARAEVVRRIFRLYADGMGLDAMARALNAEHLHHIAGKGSNWDRGYIAKLIDNPAVVGTHAPHLHEPLDKGKKLTPLPPIDGYYPAILDNETWERVQARRAHKGEPPRTAATKSVFAGGVLRCGACGSSVVRATSGGGARLVCNRAKNGGDCDVRSVRYTVVEAALLEHGPALVRAAPGGQDVDSELREAQELAEVGAGEFEAWIGEHGSSPGVEAWIVKVGEVLKDNEKRLAELSRLAESAGHRVVRQRLDGLLAALTAEPLDRAAVNTALRAATETMTLHIDEHSRKRGPVPAQVHGRVVVGWKQGGEAVARF